MRSILLAALRQYIEEAEDSHELFIAAAERAVCVEDLVFRVLIEHAMSGKSTTSFQDWSFEGCLAEIVGLLKS
jgi:hypothetical protein